MSIDIISATLHLRSVTTMTQSRDHGEPKLAGEGHEDYDLRTWRNKMHVQTIAGQRRVVVPAFGFACALASAAKYSKRQIPGQGKATWTAKFKAGIMMLNDPVLDGVDPDTVKNIRISANADGMRGSGKRVPRYFPTFPEWSSVFEMKVIDPIITEDVFREMVEIAGMYIGLGQFRPENGGTNGRFSVEKIVWRDDRK